MKIGAYANPTTYVVTGLRQITLGAAPTMGTNGRYSLVALFCGFRGFCNFWNVYGIESVYKSDQIISRSA